MGKLNLRSLAGKPLLILLLAVILIRFLLSTLPSYRIDMEGYRAWSLYLADKGPAGFYQNFHVVYAPAYMYLLWISGILAGTLSLGTASHIVLIKLWAVASEVVGGYLIYKLGVRHGKERAGLLIGTFYALNPAVFFNSSIWGQFDSIPATVLLLSVYYLILDKKVSGFIAFCAAVLIKPQSGLLAPVVLLLYFKGFSLRKEADRLKLLYSFIGGFCTYVFIVVPFYHPTPLLNKVGVIPDVFYWMIHLYGKSINDYPFATANAFNIWTLLGGQAIPDSNKFLGISFSSWGLILAVTVIAIAAIPLIRKSIHPAAPYYSAYLVLSGSFLFATRMHERYLLPALIFIFVCILFEHKLLIPSVLLSGCVLANHWYVYDKARQNIYWLENYNTFAVLFAVLTLLVFIYSMCYFVKFIKSSDKPMRHIEQKVGVPL